MHKNNKLSAILLMGGSGSRFESSTPKQFHLLDNKKIYIHTLDAFYNIQLFDETILVCHEDWISLVKEETSKYSNVKVIQGGKTRQESSYLALQSCSNPDYVVIHDSVRPFVTKRIIMDNIEAAYKHNAVDTCIPSQDTIVSINDQNKITDIPNRKYLMRGQTPQSFKYDVILKAHKNSFKKNIFNSTDDCSLILDYQTVAIVNGDERNIKITHEIDLITAQQLLQKESSILL